MCHCHRVSTSLFKTKDSLILKMKTPMTLWHADNHLPKGTVLQPSRPTFSATAIMKLSALCMAASSQWNLQYCKIYTEHRHMHNVLLSLCEQNNFTSTFSSILMICNIQFKNILFDCIHNPHTLEMYFLNYMCYMTWQQAYQLTQCSAFLGILYKVQSETGGGKENNNNNNNNLGTGNTPSSAVSVWTSRNHWRTAVLHPWSVSPPIHSYAPGDPPGDAA